MAKIAVESKQRAPTARELAAGRGWKISDVTCTAGPQDVPFEEQHSRISLAFVVSGAFQYRSSTGSEFMTPGSLLLGNVGDCFCCSHEHGSGDRCVAFSYDAECWEQILSGIRVAHSRFRAPRIPPIRELAPVAAQCLALQAGHPSIAGDELSTELAATAVQVASGTLAANTIRAEPGSLSRVSRVVRLIANEPSAPHDLDSLAQSARLSPFHFLRVFQSVTGTTPHQYLLRIRLQRAAFRLRTESTTALEIALDCGFGDASNFNRSFRAEFGMSPRAYRTTG